MASRELLPATFPTEEKARDWSGHLTHPTIIQEETRVVPSRTAPGRWQVSIKRRTHEEAEALQSLI